MDLKSKSKKRLPGEEGLPYAYVGKRSSKRDLGKKFLNDHPVTPPPRTSIVRVAMEHALDTILANQVLGKKVIVPNFEKTIHPSNVGFGREVFKKMLIHAAEVGVIDWEVPEGYSRSIISYTEMAKAYAPSQNKTVDWPLELVRVSGRHKGSKRDE